MRYICTDIICQQNTVYFGNEFYVNSVFYTTFHSPKPTMISTSDQLRRYSERPVRDWDLIVISSRDERQRRAFERQLTQMQTNANHFITDEFKFLVVSDQKFTDETSGEHKLGSGGSTLHIFRQLVAEFGDSYLKTSRILLIHSGGYSQRLPHYSVLGKLFSNLPIGLKSSDGKYWTALDVKLALLAPFAALMSAGVWVTASDDIVIYSYEESEFQSLKRFSADSIVCLGHPSDVHISLTHGVYVLDNRDIGSIHKTSVSLHDCLKVLQKPTFDELKRYKAFVANDTKEFCITDSSYYLGSDVIINRFLKFPINDFNEELDCFGHFLCPLGSDPITKTSDNRFESPLNHLLNGCQFKVLVLSESQFIHLGTIGEYIHELTDYKEKKLAKSLCFKDPDLHQTIKGTVICSQINSHSVIDTESVLEFCHFKDIAIETQNNLLYNCCVDKSSDISDKAIRFPANYLIYTVPVTVGDGKGWCTLSCQLSSQLKSSLWSRKVFPVCDTSAQSLISTLDLIKHDFNENLFADSLKLSMADIKDYQNIDAIIEYHNQLKSIF